jgi:hypothetical protein
VVVTVGEPSWQQDCYSFPGPGSSSSGYSFPAYEVFPLTVNASPGTTVRLQAGQALPTAQQLSQGGIRTNTLWTWFNPGTVVTDSTGIAKSNLTLAGAVMPFVPNDVSNVTLPIQAMTPTGPAATVGLPIEFEGAVNIIEAPGPIPIGPTLQVQMNQSSDNVLNVVYSPSGPSAPLRVSLQVLGSYANGNVGPMPSGITMSFSQPSFELAPDSIVYFAIVENNTLTPPTSATTSANYTFAVQEVVGNSTYIEPLNVAVSFEQLFAGGLGVSTTVSPLAPTAPASTPPAVSSSPAGFRGAVMTDLAIVAVVLIVVLSVTVLHARGKRNPVKPGEGQAPVPS